MRFLIGENSPQRRGDAEPSGAWNQYGEGTFIRKAGRQERKEMGTRNTDGEKNLHREQRGRFTTETRRHGGGRKIRSTTDGHE